jgi:hypothetical protein
MKRNNTAFLFVFGILTCILPSCEKNSEPGTVDNVPPLFQACSCTEDKNNEYIKGVFDNVPMCFSTRFGFENNNFDNINYIGPNQDQLNMIRTDNRKRVQIAIFWQKSKIWSRVLPYILPRADWDTCEGAEIQINDLLTGNTVFMGHSGFGLNGHGEMKYAITEVNGNMISGSFSGKMFDENRRSPVTVTNGEFRLSILKSVVK